MLNSARWFSCWIMLCGLLMAFYANQAWGQDCSVPAQIVSQEINTDDSVTVIFEGLAPGLYGAIDFTMTSVDVQSGLCEDGLPARVVLGEGTWHAFCTVTVAKSTWEIIIFPSGVTIEGVRVGDVDDTIDADGDGSNVCSDCNDADPTVYRNATEVCDGKDNNCNDIVDEGITVGSFYLDADGDGYGTGTGIQTCAPSAGYVDTNGDCDDSDESSYPGAVEACDDVDNDCDKQIDEDFDRDDDGFTTCGGDCDDNGFETHPTATEICDGFDNDCDGSVPSNEVDADGDGYRVCRGDCDDTVSTTYPGSIETCGDDIDNNCDGTVDGEGCSGGDPTPVGDDDDSSLQGDDDTTSSQTPTPGDDDASVTATILQGDDDTTGGDDDSSPADTPGSESPTSAGDDDVASTSTPSGDDDGVTPTATEDDETESVTGCGGGCTTIGEQMPASWWALTLLALLLVWRRRRLIA